MVVLPLVVGASAGCGGSARGLDQGPIASLIADPANPLTLYAAADFALLKSSDRGKSWRLIGFEQKDLNALAIDARSPETIYAAVDNPGADVDPHGFESIDGGRSWWLASLKGWVVDALVLDPRNPRTIYAAIDYGGIFKSSDGGRTWRRVFRTNDVNAYPALALDPQHPRILYAATAWGGVFKSADGARTWRRVFKADVEALVLDPHDPTTIFVGTSEGIFKSTDGARTWRKSGLSGYDVTALWVDPYHAQTVYAWPKTDPPSMFKSRNGGRSWTLTDQPIDCCKKK